MTPRTDPTHRVDETITRQPHAPHDPDITAGHDPTPDPTHPTHPDPTFPSPSIQGRERGPAGPRARANAARAAFTTARNRGLIARHRAKLRHLGIDLTTAELEAHLTKGHQPGAASHDRLQPGGTS